jgi:hypothetical protein
MKNHTLYFLNVLTIIMMAIGGYGLGSTNNPRRGRIYAWFLGLGFLGAIGITIWKLALEK